MKKLFICIPILALFLAWSCSSPPVNTIGGIPNLRMVEAGVYRGGQPPDRNSFVFLQSLGISNIVKLNLKKEGSDDAAIALGMTVQYFPIDVFQQVAAKPSAQTVSNAVAAIKPGTFFHCEHGEDRTGLIGACYRIWKMGWPKSVARAEMLQFRFHRSLHGLDDFFEDDVHEEKWQGGLDLHQQPAVLETAALNVELPPCPSSMTLLENRTRKNWWSRRDSHSRPSHCQCAALLLSYDPAPRGSIEAGITPLTCGTPQSIKSRAESHTAVATAVLSRVGYAPTHWSRANVLPGYRRL